VDETERKLELLVTIVLVLGEGGLDMAGLDSLGVDALNVNALEWRGVDVLGGLVALIKRFCP